jgi:hypothetical protein
METWPNRDPGLAGCKGGLAGLRISKHNTQKIASNQKTPDLQPNQNQLPPNFNHMVTMQYVSYP